jgi:hypothetical protein
MVGRSNVREERYFATVTPSHGIVNDSVFAHMYAIVLDKDFVIRSFRDGAFKLAPVLLASLPRHNPQVPLRLTATPCMWIGSFGSKHPAYLACLVRILASGQLLNLCHPPMNRR